MNQVNRLIAAAKCQAMCNAVETILRPMLMMANSAAAANQINGALACMFAARCLFEQDAIAAEEGMTIGGVL